MRIIQNPGRQIMKEKHFLEKNDVKQSNVHTQIFCVSS